MRPPGSAEFLEARRLRALEYMGQGLQPVEIARKIGVDRRSVRRWKARILKDGPEGIRAKPSRGRPSRLGPREKKRLEAILLRGARQADFSTDLWTCPRVIEVTEKVFGVHYHVNHIGRVLHALGWSPQTPQRRAVERAEEAIQSWIKADWPRVIKTLRG